MCDPVHKFVTRPDLEIQVEALVCYDRSCVTHRIVVIMLDLGNSRYSGYLPLFQSGLRAPAGAGYRPIPLFTSCNTGRNNGHI